MGILECLGRRDTGSGRDAQGGADIPVCAFFGIASEGRASARPRSRDPPGFHLRGYAYGGQVGGKAVNDSEGGRIDRRTAIRRPSPIFLPRYAQSRFTAG